LIFASLKTKIDKGIIPKKVIAFSFDNKPKKKTIKEKNKYLSFLLSRYFKLNQSAAKAPARENISSRPLILATISTCNG